jgi:hypothetical protein
MRIDKEGENRAAAAAAAVARRKWREAQLTASNTNGPLVWVRTADRLPEDHQIVLSCADPSQEFNPKVQIEVFVKPSKWDADLLKNLDGGAENGRDFTPELLGNVDGAFWDIDNTLSVSTDDWFPVYWMPLPKTPWE